MESGFNPFTSIYKTTYPSSPTIPLSPTLSLPHFLLSLLPSLPSKPAFIDAITGESLTYSSLLKLTISIANSLRSLGLSRGDVVLFLSPNSLHFPALSLAILSLGAIFSPANFLHTRSELSIQIQDSNPSLIMTATNLQEKVQGLGKVLLIEPFLASLITNLTPIPVQIQQSDVAAVMYSSGTTGKSKGVKCTHGNLIAMAAVLQHIWGAGSTSSHVYACVVPLFHMFGFSVFICGAIAAGATVVIMRKYNLEDLLIAVEEYRITRMPAVPPMVVQMVRSGDVVKGYDIGSLKEVICSGAPLAREHMESFVESYPHITLTQCYGLTETSGPITLCDGVKSRYQTSIGRLIPSIEAKIIDIRTGKSLPPNKFGELRVRGPPIMQGYLKNPEATSLAIDEEGWLRTGDLCYIDLRGLVYVVDRIKELIKYKAYQVAPAELEEILSTHPDIHDAAVTS
nr:4-coumarate-CoA ligase 5 [Leucojum aestivum]